MMITCLNSIKQLFHLKTDQVVGVVPRDGRIHAQNDAVVRNSAG